MNIADPSQKRLALLAPNTVAGSAAFGTITAAGDPRILQLAIKFRF